MNKLIACACSLAYLLLAINTVAGTTFCESVASALYGILAVLTYLAHRE